MKMEQVGDDLKMTDFNNFDMGGYFPTKMIGVLVSSISKK
jgi:hypothetical protein